MHCTQEKWQLNYLYRSDRAGEGQTVSGKAEQGWAAERERKTMVLVSYRTR